MRTPLSTWLTSYAVAAVTYGAVDVAWISTVANSQYRSQIGHLLAPTPNVAGAAVFYLVYVVGIVHYGVRPNDPDATVWQRVRGAALFGFLTYATWALTALAVLDGFPLVVAVTDMVWGAAVCGLVTLVTATLLRRTLTTTA